MGSTLWLCAALLSQAAPSTHAGATPAAANETHSREGVEALIKRALACEASGRDAERLRYLARAVLIDPQNARARGLMGLVAYGGRWLFPDQVSRQAKADEALRAKLAEYEARREDVLGRVERLLRKEAIARALAQYRENFELFASHRRQELQTRRGKAAQLHLGLALWCERNNLRPEGIAHFSRAGELDPKLRTPWERLGCKRHEGRWMTVEQIVADRREDEAQRRADRHWDPLLRKWKRWLGQRERRHEAQEHLASVGDPRAVPSIWSVFARGDEYDQGCSVKLFGQIDSPEATQALALLSVFGASVSVRNAATNDLLSRDSRDVITDLIDLFQPPLRYSLEPPKGYFDEAYDSIGVLVVEGESSIYKRSYRRGDAYQGSFIRGTPMAQLINGMVSERLSKDLREIQQHNRDAERVNGRIADVLRIVTGQSPEKNDADSWKRWWAQQQGYAYEAVKTEDKTPMFGEFNMGPPRILHTSCFGPGTLVQTFTGPRPIESIKFGDRVLTQDTVTGVLGYQPAVAIHHNLPCATLRLTVAGEGVVTTGIHRFWKPGRGWVMARDLKPGDRVRIVGGTAMIEAVTADATQKVYNLDVARDRDFFVGRSGMLVHDFSVVEAVTEPFDASPGPETE